MPTNFEPKNSGDSDDSLKVTAATKREFPDPVEESRPLPSLVLILIGAVLSFGLVYFQMYQDGESTGGKGSGAASVEQAPAEPTLAELGKSIYANCQPCHQASGLGIPGQFPTLVGSEWVSGSDKRLIAILLKGLNGPVKVAGATYNGAMPAWEKVLSDKKIAAVLTYTRSSWGNKFPEITESMVAAVKKEFAAKADAWSEADLLAIPEGAVVAAAPAAASAGTATAPAAPAAVDLEAGKAQYQAICIACHQPTGAGLPPVFPPLLNSEYVKGNPERMIAIVLNGVMGPITVDGKSYTNMMPAQGAVLTDAKISQVLSYVRKNFGEGASEVTTEQVTEARKKYGSRPASWTEAELKAFPETK